MILRGTEYLLYIHAILLQCTCVWGADGLAFNDRITKWQRRRTTAALAIAHTAEEADKVLLTSMYLAIGNSLNALPSQLGQLTMWRALVQASLLLLC